MSIPVVCRVITYQVRKWPPRWISFRLFSCIIAAPPSHYTIVCQFPSLHRHHWRRRGGCGGGVVNIACEVTIDGRSWIVMSSLLGDRVPAAIVLSITVWLGFSWVSGSVLARCRRSVVASSDRSNLPRRPSPIVYQTPGAESCFPAPTTTPFTSGRAVAVAVVIFQ